MNPTFRLAVLECDTPVAAVQGTRGSYGEVFRQLLAKGLTDLEDKGRISQLCLTKWDVVESQEYPKADEVDGILLTGSKHTAFANEPWIISLVEFVRNFSTTTKPIVGICFGHQIIGRALGAKVDKSPGGWEISVDKINVSKEGRDLLGVSSLALHQMHRDAVLDIPQGLVNLGSSPSCAIQGLYQPGRVLSFQAHPEFDGSIMTEILKSRHEQKIFDDQMLSDGTARAHSHHDGAFISARIWEFLLASQGRAR
ncbi:putative glutamine amidotransferase-like protein [Tolypocladium ophioglossoides CBS 100239]|uniref:Putative glutamine amidotransferase-like protein n=1 Tax=Tolypocladium ophioglossoides (strain CBS 100239) TaxID=1163406 RepID=A0A0L0N2Q8_TOLOC|nr:putative glutamine amidotransferase-like protein [Tolypocladium ophioglossoides CBS 100239]